ncbi:hypothetical protein J4408_00360 [Candidatus Pacearchaeota archaeon]|nr:hypothetical protein [Candidatus Pacearchaeota archaeon]
MQLEKLENARKKVFISLAFIALIVISSFSNVYFVAAASGNYEIQGEKYNDKGFGERFFDGIEKVKDDVSRGINSIKKINFGNLKLKSGLTGNVVSENSITGFATAGTQSFAEFEAPNEYLRVYLLKNKGVGAYYTPSFSDYYGLSGVREVFGSAENLESFYVSEKLTDIGAPVNLISDAFKIKKSEVTGKYYYPVLKGEILDDIRIDETERKVAVGQYYNIMNLLRYNMFAAETAIAGIDVFVWRLDNPPIPSLKLDYPDISENPSYFSYINDLYSQPIEFGIPESEFLKGVEFKKENPLGPQLVALKGELISSLKNQRTDPWVVLPETYKFLFQTVYPLEQRVECINKLSDYTVKLQLSAGFLPGNSPSQNVPQTCQEYEDLNEIYNLGGIHGAENVRDYLLDKNNDLLEEGDDLDLRVNALKTIKAPWTLGSQFEAYNLLGYTPQGVKDGTRAQLVANRAGIVKLYNDLQEATIAMNDPEMSYSDIKDKLDFVLKPELVSHYPELIVEEDKNHFENLEKVNAQFYLYLSDVKIKLDKDVANSFKESTLSLRSQVIFALALIPIGYFAGPFGSLVGWFRAGATGARFISASAFTGLAFIATDAAFAAGAIGEAVEVCDSIIPDKPLGENSPQAIADFGPQELDEYKSACLIAVILAGVNVATVVVPDLVGEFLAKARNIETATGKEAQVTKWALETEMAMDKFRALKAASLEAHGFQGIVRLDLLRKNKLLPIKIATGSDFLSENFIKNIEIQSYKKGVRGLPLEKKELLALKMIEGYRKQYDNEIVNLFKENNLVDTTGFELLSSQEKMAFVDSNFHLISEEIYNEAKKRPRFVQAEALKEVGEKNADLIKANTDTFLSIVYEKKPSQVYTVDLNGVKYAGKEYFGQAHIFQSDLADKVKTLHPELVVFNDEVLEIGRLYLETGGEFSMLDLRDMLLSFHDQLIATGYSGGVVWRMSNADFRVYKGFFGDTAIDLDIPGEVGLIDIGEGKKLQSKLLFIPPMKGGEVGIIGSRRAVEEAGTLLVLKGLKAPKIRARLVENIYNEQVYTSDLASFRDFQIVFRERANNGQPEFWGKYMIDTETGESVLWSSGDWNVHHIGILEAMYKKSHPELDYSPIYSNKVDSEIPLTESRKYLGGELQYNYAKRIVTANTDSSTDIWLAEAAREGKVKVSKQALQERRDIMNEMLKKINEELTPGNSFNIKLNELYLDSNSQFYIPESALVDDLVPVEIPIPAQ